DLAEQVRDFLEPADGVGLDEHGVLVALVGQECVGVGGERESGNENVTVAVFVNAGQGCLGFGWSKGDGGAYRGSGLRQDGAVARGTGDVPDEADDDN